MAKEKTKANPKPKPKLIDEHVSSEQCKKAVDALLAHEKDRAEKQQEGLLLPGKEQNVWLQVTVKRMHPEKKLKPHKIPIAHPLVDPRVSPICLITKDPQREYKDLLEKHNIKFISRVVGITKLKGKFKPFEARRLLLKENDLFLADERVVPLLPGLLGKKFFEAKKQPIPVNLTRKDLKGELERAVSSTYFHQNQGTCSSIKIGTLSQSATQVLANLETALPAVVKAIEGGWDNIQSLHIKTNSSVSLPIWTCDLGAGEGGRWDKLEDVEMVEGAPEDEGGSDESEEEAEESEEAEETPSSKKKLESDPAKGDPKKKGKKRAAESEENEKPKKKAKSAAPNTSDPTPISSTPSSKKSKANLSPSSTIAPPPNTPATGLVASAPAGSKKKQKGQSAPEMPISSVIEKLEEGTKGGASLKEQAEPKVVKEKAEKPISVALNTEVVPASPEKPTRKPRQRKKKANAQEAEGESSPAPAPTLAAPSSVPGSSEPTPKAATQGRTSGGAGADQTGKKAKKQKAKASELTGFLASSHVSAPVTTSVPKTSLTAEELKQKKSASGVEKKKEKAGKVKRSAKDAVIGKKV